MDLHTRHSRVHPSHLPDPPFQFFKDLVLRLGLEVRVGQVNRISDAVLSSWVPHLFPFISVLAIVLFYGRISV